MARLNLSALTAVRREEEMARRHLEQALCYV